MKKYRSLGVNALLNAFKSGLSVLFPLITYPYALRVLQPEGIGKVNYASSIVSYFALVASLGISTYAVREGAKLRDDRSKIETFAKQIFTINVTTTIISYIALFFCLVFVNEFRNYALLILISSISIAMGTLGLEWMNTIYEDYLFITIRSIVTHLVTLCVLFIFVKGPEDCAKYALLSVLTTTIICISNMFYCRRYISIGLTRNVELAKHIKPILIMFANMVATSIYVNADVTMLGWMCGDYYTGLYTLATKVYGVAKKMMVSLYSVAIPRISLYAGNHDFENLKKIYTSLMSSITIVLIPASAGLIVLSKEVVQFMGGEEYGNSVLTLQLLSVALVGAIFGGAVTYVLNIPLGREKNNVIATIFSAVINIGLNVFFIKEFQQNGAAITTAISEFFVFFFCLFKTKDIKEYLDIRKWLSNVVQAGIGVIWIVFVSVVARLLITNTLLLFFGIIAVSVLGYAVVLMALHNDVAFLYLGKILKKKLGNKGKREE